MASPTSQTCCEPRSTRSTNSPRMRHYGGSSFCFRRGLVMTEPERLQDFCSDSRTRTLDPAVNSRLLYQLS